MTSSVPAAMPDEHRLHDRLLVVRSAVEKLDPADRPAADALLERCAECRELADDARALRTELAALPAPARARDFRLSAADAERLQGGFLQRLLAPLGSQSFALLQPLAGAAIAVGLGLLVLTSIPSGALFGQASRAQDGGAPGLGGAPAAASAGPTAAIVGGAPQASGEPGTNEYGQQGGAKTTTGPGEGGAEIATDQATRTLAERESATSPDWRGIGLVLFLAGLGLFVVRRIATREASDPLLR
jgi:hypothetical protein